MQSELNCIVFWGLSHMDKLSLFYGVRVLYVRLLDLVAE